MIKNLGRRGERLALDAVQGSLWAAKHGFAGMTVPIMNKLLRLTGKKYKVGTRPSTEAALVKALAEHYLDAVLAEDDLKDIRAYRKKSVPDDASLGLLFSKEENIDIAEEAVCAEDLGEIMRFKKEALQRAGRATARSEGGAPGGSEGLAVAGSGGAAGSSGDPPPLPPPGRPKVPIAGAVAPEFVRDLLPKPVGCRVSLDNVRHHRWTGTYPMPPPRAHVSKCYMHTGFSRAGALVHVLATSWSWHLDSTGEVCPFIFDEGLLEAELGD